MQAIKLISTNLIFFVCLSLNLSNISAQTSVDFAKSREFEKKAIDSYRMKDMPAFLENIRQAGEFRPNHPRLIYNLAAAYAANGKPSEALAFLKRLAAMGLYFSPDKGNDFKSLPPEALASVLALYSQNKQPVNASTRSFTLTDKELIPESITYDPASGRYFIGSIHKSKIVSIDKAGAVADFSSPTDGLWSISGMKVDVKRRLLWVCTSAFPQMKGYESRLEGRSGIVKYDLKTGKLLKKYLLPAGEKHVLGDLGLDKKGNVYATDSLAPNIYRITAARDDLEVFATDPIFVSLQGITFNSDEKKLFVADYSKGIFLVEMSTKKVTQLIPLENVALLGIDGLYFHAGSLIAIQNGVSPNRVISISMDPEQNRALSTRTLEANHADFLEPTLGAIVGDEFFYIANSQWPLVNEKAELAADKLREPVVLKLQLPIK